MTELYLSKDGAGWHQVYFSTNGSGFKLTRENPYFTESESYTLDITLPMDILENRQFFGNIQRIDASKKSMKYKCRLVVDDKPMLDGTAKVTQVTYLDVKVQLLGGNSELNFNTADEKVYIDEMELAHNWGFFWVSYDGKLTNDENTYGSDFVVYMPAYDETNAETVNHKSYDETLGTWKTLNRISFDYNGKASIHRIAPQPNLIYIIKGVLELSGYKVVRFDIDSEPWNRLFVASAKVTSVLSHVLPHWTVKEFLAEVSRFFNCTFVFDSSAMTASVIGNEAYFRDSVRTVIEPLDEYTSELNDGDDSAEVLASSNVEYDMSSSESHNIDVLSSEVRKAIPVKAYSSELEALQAFDAMDDKEKMKYMFVSPEGKFVGWESDENSVTKIGIKHLDFFAPVIRDEDSDDSIELKICPVAMTVLDECLHYRFGHSDEVRMSCPGPALENPTGNEPLFGTGDDSLTAQEMIEGDGVDDKAEKEDRLQVMFIDDQKQWISIPSGNDKGKKLEISLPFTDWRYLQNPFSEHRHWSLGFTNTGADHYTGQLHAAGFSFNVKAKQTFKFVADRMPDPAAVFQIRGKLYGCEKIEATVTEEGVDRLMTGYFYELL